MLINLYLLSKVFCLFRSFLNSNSYYSFANDNFKLFLNNFLNEKVSINYDKTIINDLKKNSYFIKRVVELDRSQPEFTLSLNQYLNKAVSANRVKKAIKLYKENYSLLKKIEKHIAIPILLKNKTSIYDDIAKKILKL